MTTETVDCPAFSIGAHALTVERNDNRVVSTFTAPSRRKLDGGFELVGVWAYLYDSSGRFVVRRSAESYGGRLFVLDNRAVWSHELLDDQWNQAAHLVYEIEARVDVRRRLADGPLPELPPLANASDYWRWLPDAGPIEDPLAQYDFALFARRSAVDAVALKTVRAGVESARTDLQLDLADAEGMTIASLIFGMAGGPAAPGHGQASTSLDRKRIRSLRTFSLQARTEARFFTRLPPIAITPG